MNIARRTYVHTRVQMYVRTTYHYICAYTSIEVCTYHIPPVYIYTRNAQDRPAHHSTPQHTTTPLRENRAKCKCPATRLWKHLRDLSKCTVVLVGCASHVLEKKGAQKYMFCYYGLGCVLAEPRCSQSRFNQTYYLKLESMSSVSVLYIMGYSQY